MTSTDPYAKQPPSGPPMQSSGASLQPLALPAGTGAGTGQPVLVGDITVQPDGIFSPQGRLPLEGAQIQVTNMTRPVSKTPTWAVVVAILGFFIVTVFSLFFLLAKETVIEGGYEVRASGPTGQLVSFVPVTQQTAGWIWQDLQQRAAAANALIRGAA